MKRLEKAYGNLNYKCKRTICESVIALGLIATIFISFLVDLSVVSVPFWLVHKFSDTEGLLLTLFTVQASVSTLGIALVSIINGSTNETIYGISITRYITKIKPVFFTHNRLIIINLIIVMANYIAISFVWFNISVAFFLVSIAITILLTAEVFLIFLGKDSITKEIQQYILENYSDVVLIDLNKEMLNSIENGNSLITKQDCGILLEVLRCEAQKSNYTATKITEQIVNIAADGFDKVACLHNHLKSVGYLEFICDLYDVANEKEDAPLRITLWPQIDTSFFKVLEELQYEYLRDNYPHLKLHSRIHKNLVGASVDELKASALQHYLGWVYYTLFADSTAFRDKDSDRLKKSLFQHAYFRVVGNKSESSELEQVTIIELCYLNKAAIDTGDVDALTKYYFKRFQYSSDESHDIVCLITVIYLYYLSCRETLVNEKAIQRNAKDILLQNKSIVSNFLDHNLPLSAILSSHYPFIQGILNRWEYMEEGDAKWMVIDSVVTDFFILTALYRFWDRKDILDAVKMIVPTSMFSLYNRYFPDAKFSLLRNMATEFAKMFFPYITEDLAVEKLYLLKDVFDEKYRTETIMEGTEKAITEKQLNRLSSDVVAEIDSVIAKYPLLKSFGYYEEADTIIEENDVLLLSTTIPNFVIEDTDYMKYLREHLQYCALATFFRTLRDFFILQTLDYEQPDKQETLIQMLQESGVEADLVVGSRELFWEERDKDLLQKATENMSRIKLPDNANGYYLIDSRRTSFLLHDIEVRFADLSWEEIMENCRETEDGKLEFNVTNNLYVPFEKPELQKHFALTRKKMLVYGSIKHKKPTTPIGVGIEIKHK